MCHQLIIVPTKEDSDNFYTNLREEPINIKKLQIRKSCPTYILGSLNCLPIIYKYYGKTNLFLFSKLDYEKCLCQISEVEKKIHEFERIVRVDDLVFMVAKAFAEKKYHPVVKSLHWLNIRKDFCNQLIFELVDPRLYVEDCKPFSVKHINRVFRYCGLSYRVFSDKFKRRNTDDLTKTCLYCWYSADKYKKFSLELKENNIKRILTPNESSPLSVEHPKNHFWRTFFNLSSVGFDPKAAFKVTKMFMNIFLRFWGFFLECREIEPTKLFRYEILYKECEKRLHELIKMKDIDYWNSI